MFNLSVLHIWFKTWMESPCMFNLFGSKLLDGIFLYVQFVYFMSGSNFCIESSCMFNLSVFNVWYKTFGWNHSVCSTCLFFMSDSKLLDWIFLNVQFVSTSCLVQNLDGITLYVQLVRFKTFGWNLLVCSICLLHVWFKLLYWIILYVQLVSI